MTTYINPFTGQTVSPSQVGYESLSISTDTTLQWPINGNDTNIVANIIEVTATTTSLKLIMPSAQQVSNGQAVIIRNIGSNTFTVTNASLGTIVSIASGVAQYVYLTDNSTTNGVWSTVTFGAGTSSANAATLAGYGLTAIGTTLNQSYSVSNYYSSATITSALRAQFAVWFGGAGTLTMPSAGAVGANWFCMIRNNGTGILTINPAGTDTIDGNSNQQLQLTESLVIVSNGSGWNTFGYGRSNSFAYTQLALTVTGGTTTLTATQASNTIQEYSGILTSNQTIIVPSTVQLYTVTNNTSGSYTFTVKTSVVGGATVTVTQGTSLVLICDGTNVYNAASGTSSILTNVTLGNGTLASPSLRFSGDLNSGLYLPSAGQVGVVISNTQAAYFSSAGLSVAGTGTFTSGISGGTF
jgi:hypothetical protein